jgi:hypothetical protein
VNDIISLDVSNIINPDEVYAANCAKNHAISALFKLIIYQNDSGRILTQELVTKVFTLLLPLKDDIEEA